MKTQENTRICADVRKNMNSREFEKSIESVLNDYNISKEEKVVQLFKLGLFPNEIIDHIRVGLAEVYSILYLAKKEGIFNKKLTLCRAGARKARRSNNKKQEYCEYLKTKDKEYCEYLKTKDKEYCEYLKTKEKNNERKEQTVVAFQVGTLSKYAPKKKGTLTYLGEYNFKDIQNLRADEIFYKEKDGKTIITDEMGNIVSDDDPNGDVGVLNFDEEYDTTYCKYLQDCTDEEIEIINNDNLIFD